MSGKVEIGKKRSGMEERGRMIETGVEEKADSREDGESRASEKLELERGERQTLQNNEHGRKQAVNVVCLCVFVPVCASTDSQWGQRVSVAPCVAYKLIKDNHGGGKCTPLPTLCEYVRVAFRVRGKRENQPGTQEACGLKVVLENGLQIEIGSSGSADRHTRVTVHWSSSAVGASRDFCYSSGRILFTCCSLVFELPPLFLSLF